MAGPVILRLRILDGEGRRWLATPRGQPGVKVSGQARDQPWIVVQAALDQLGLRIAVLRITSFDEIEVECLDCEAAERGGSLHWEDAQDPGGSRAWWEEPGWLVRTLAEADEHLAHAGLRRVGPPMHTRQTSVTAMLRIPTDRGAVWLKALPAMFAHEPRVVQVMARFEPKSVPEVVAATSRWWLAREMPPEADDPRGDPLIVLARMQQESATWLTQLRRAGCAALPIATLSDDVKAVAEREELGASGLGEEVSGLCPALGQICSDLAAVGLPETVVHGDLQSANVRWTGAGWVLFDWTDATTGHPFADLASPLAQERPEVGRRRAEAFAAAWSEVAPAEAVAAALAMAPAVGAAHQVVNYGKIYRGMEAYGADAANPDQMGGLLRFWASTLVEAVGGRAAA